MRTRWVLLGIGALGVLVLFLFPAWWPLINNSSGQVAMPGLLDLPPAERDIIEEMARTDSAMAQAFIAAGLAEPVNAPEDEETMSSAQSPEEYSNGRFSELDAVHWARGTATIYELADGSALLRFDEFAVRNGPDLQVLLSSSIDPTGMEDVLSPPLNGFSLGPLKGTEGNQNYALPPEFDLSLAQSVVIYAEPFDVIMSFAPLIRG